MQQYGNSLKGNTINPARDDSQSLFKIWVCKLNKWPADQCLNKAANNRINLSGF